MLKIRFLKIILSSFALFYRLRAKYLIINIIDFLRGQVIFCKEKHTICKYSA